MPRNARKPGSCFSTHGWKSTTVNSSRNRNAAISVFEGRLRGTLRVRLESGNPNTRVGCFPLALQGRSGFGVRHIVELDRIKPGVALVWGLLSAILGEKRGQVRFVSATLLWTNLGTASRQRHSVFEKLESAALRRNFGRAVRFTSPRGRGRSPGAFFSRPAVTYFSGHFLSMHCRMNGSLTAWSVESSVRATRPNPQKTQIRR